MIIENVAAEGELNLSSASDNRMTMCHNAGHLQINLKTDIPVGALVSVMRRGGDIHIRAEECYVQNCVMAGFGVRNTGGDEGETITLIKADAENWFIKSEHGSGWTVDAPFCAVWDDSEVWDDKLFWFENRLFEDGLWDDAAAWDDAKFFCSV